MDGIVRCGPGRVAVGLVAAMATTLTTRPTDVAHTSAALGRVSVSSCEGAERSGHAGDSRDLVVASRGRLQTVGPPKA